MVAVNEIIEIIGIWFIPKIILLKSVNWRNLTDFNGIILGRNQLPIVSKKFNY